MATLLTSKNEYGKSTRSPGGTVGWGVAIFVRGLICRRLLLLSLCCSSSVLNVLLRLIFQLAGSRVGFATLLANGGVDALLPSITHQLHKAATVRATCALIWQAQKQQYGHLVPRLDPLYKFHEAGAKVYFSEGRVLTEAQWDAERAAARLQRATAGPGSNPAAAVTCAGDKAGAEEEVVDGGVSEEAEADATRSSAAASVEVEVGEPLAAALVESEQPSRAASPPSSTFVAAAFPPPSVAAAVAASTALAPAPAPVEVEDNDDMDEEDGACASGPLGARAREPQNSDGDEDEDDAEEGEGAAGGSDGDAASSSDDDDGAGDSEDEARFEKKKPVGVAVGAAAGSALKKLADPSAPPAFSALSPTPPLTAVEMEKVKALLLQAVAASTASSSGAAGVVGSAETASAASAASSGSAPSAAAPASRPGCGDDDAQFAWDLSPELWDPGSCAICCRFCTQQSQSSHPARMTHRFCFCSSLVFPVAYFVRQRIPTPRFACRPCRPK
jgi:hypothetical protein